MFDNTIYQFVYSLPNGTLYRQQPFSIRYICDRGYFSDWTEWDINSLADPVEVGFTLSDGVITEIDTSREDSSE